MAVVFRGQDGRTFYVRKATLAELGQQLRQRENPAKYRHLGEPVDLVSANFGAEPRSVAACEADPDQATTPITGKLVARVVTILASVQ